MAKYRPIVIAPAKTGRDKSNKKAVMKIAQTNNGILWNAKLLDLILVIVQIKFIAPKIEAAPDKCKLKIAKSTEPPEWAVIPDNGGYTVHPVPTPASQSTELINNNSAGGNNQKLMLFILGNAISGLPIIRGTNQLPLEIGHAAQRYPLKEPDMQITLHPAHPNEL
jgi:hypothetical protein